MKLFILYFTTFLIPILMVSYALIYRKQKVTGANNLLALSLPLAIAAETIAMYGVSLTQISPIWPAWVLIAAAFTFFSLAVDEWCCVDMFHDALVKFGVFPDHATITDTQMGEFGVVYRGVITLVAIAAVCTAVNLAVAVGQLLA